MLRSLMMMMMMLKTINMFSLPVQVRANESTEAREARLARDRIQTAKVKHVNVVDAGDVHRHVEGCHQNFFSEKLGLLAQPADPPCKLGRQKKKKKFNVYFAF